MDKSNRNMWKPDELAEYFQVTKRTIYRLIERRRLPFYKVSGRIRFKHEDIKEYMESGRVRAIK